MIFFTSDTHESHENIIGFSNRPFSSGDEMNEEMIDRWNSVIKDSDEVYHLGDLAWWKKNHNPSSYVRRLKGHKHLIRGNHDLLTDNEYLKMGFLSVQSYKEIKFNKQKMILCHFPILSWNGQRHNTYMIHGHTHHTICNLNAGMNRIDVGVDGFNFYPVSFDELKETLETDSHRCFSRP